MNKKNKKNTTGNLSFKRETVRTLNADELGNAAGGMACLTSCRGATCPRSVCTITFDSTL